MNIPSIYREKIASSVVGTPGVDTSGMAIGQSIAKGADEVAAPIWEYAIKEQNMKDEAQYHTLMGQHKLNMLQASEAIKQKYASNPDAAGPALLEVTKNSISDISKQATNPRVKLAVGLGDAPAETQILGDMYKWTYEQNFKNTVDHAAQVINESGNRIMPIGFDLNATIEDMKAKMLPEVSLLASEVAAIKVYDPILAREIELKGMKSFYKQLLDATLESQPEKASALANDSEVTKYFTADEVKTYKETAISAIKGFPEKEKARQIQQGMAENTNLLGDIREKKIGFSGLDALQRKDPDGMTSNANFWKYAKEISLGVGGTADIAERDSIRGALINDAIALGLHDPSVPTQLTRKKENKVLLSNSVEKLYGFRDKVFSAQARGLISEGEAQTYLDEIYVPLISKTLKESDPGFFKKLVDSASGLVQMVSPGAVKSIFKATHPEQAQNFHTAAGGFRRSFNPRGRK